MLLLNLPMPKIQRLILKFEAGQTKMHVTTVSETAHTEVENMFKHRLF